MCSGEDIPVSQFERSSTNLINLPPNSSNPPPSPASSPLPPHPPCCRLFRRRPFSAPTLKTTISGRSPNMPCLSQWFFPYTHLIASAKPSKAIMVKNLTKKEFVHILHRKSIEFSRGSSKYRSVTLHKCGRWEARMGQLLGKKFIYHGLYDTEIEVARAYDKAALQRYRKEVITNYDASSCVEDLICPRKMLELDMNLWKRLFALL